MRPERWKQVERVFQAAAEIPEEDRPRFVARKCGADLELRNEVATLLDAYVSSREFTTDDLRENLSSRAGRCEPTRRRFGAYSVIRRLGRGGMGTVYLAARSDAEYERHVAIKVLDTNPANELLHERFLVERQILARLEHPNIARMYEGGTVGEKIPYFVMEYVDGAPIIDYCDTERLSIEDRVRLFLDVCSAVSYAHQNLVIHRDLKPTNILVTAGGTPKLLDFGIAKILAPNGSATDLTTSCSHPMTPPYASPEQLRGEAVTTATDIYSLGVLLYELLTGHLPHRSSLTARVEELVSNREPLYPSRVVLGRSASPADDGVGARCEELGRVRRMEPGALARHLAGDLDAIVLKALRQTPGERYPTVESLAEDLRRFGEGLPVYARRGTIRYRTEKYLRRNRLVLLFALLVSLVTTAFLVTTVHQSRRIATERDHARQVSRHMIEMFEVLSPEEGLVNGMTVQRFLDLGAQRAASEFADDPALQAALLDTIGRVYTQIGVPKKAIPLLERGRELRDAALGSEHPLVASSWHNLAAAARSEGRLGDADAYAGNALEIRRRFLGDEDPAVADSLSLMAGIAAERRDLKVSEKLFREALAILEGADGGQDRRLAKVLSGLAAVMTDQGRMQEAKDLLGVTIELQRRVPGHQHPEFAMSLSRMANLHYQEGDFQLAESLYRQALELRLRYFEEDHPLVADNLNTIGRCLYRRGNLEEAETFYRRAIEINRRARPNDHIDLATQLNNLAVVLQDRSRYEEAISTYSESLEMTTRLFGPSHPWTLRSRYNLAECLKHKGDLVGARAEYRRIFEKIEALSDTPAAAFPRMGYADLLLKIHEPDRALSTLREALSILREYYSEDHWRIGVAEGLMGNALMALDRYREAEDHLLRSHDVLRSRSAEIPSKAKQAVQRLIVLYELTNQDEKAREYQALLADEDSPSPR